MATLKSIKGENVNKYGKNGNEHNKQLCWQCQNAFAHKCSWFKNGTPVKNWIARPYVITQSEYPDMETMDIIFCPSFIKDTPRLKIPTSEHIPSNLELLPVVCEKFDLSINDLFGKNDRIEIWQK